MIFLHSPVEEDSRHSWTRGSCCEEFTSELQNTSITTTGNLSIIVSTEFLLCRYVITTADVMVNIVSRTVDQLGVLCDCETLLCSVSKWQQHYIPSWGAYRKCTSSIKVKHTFKFPITKQIILDRSWPWHVQSHCTNSELVDGVHKTETCKEKQRRFPEFHAYC